MFCCCGCCCCWFFAFISCTYMHFSGKLSRFSMMWQLNESCKCVALISLAVILRLAHWNSWKLKLWGHHTNLSILKMIWKLLKSFQVNNPFQSCSFSYIISEIQRDYFCLSVIKLSQILEKVQQVFKWVLINLII